MRREGKKTVTIIICVLMLLLPAGCGVQEGIAPAGSYELDYRGITISIDGDMRPVQEALGMPDGYFEADSSTIGSVNKMYSYGSLWIDTYPSENGELIASITLMNESLATNEGISVGQTLEDLEAAYGPDYTTQDTMLVYDRNGMKLCFNMEGDTIVSIRYQSKIIE